MPAFPINTNPATTGIVDRVSFGGLGSDDTLEYLVAGSEAVDGTAISARLRAPVQPKAIPAVLKKACADAGVSLSPEQFRRLLIGLAEHGTLAVRSATAPKE